MKMFTPISYLTGMLAVTTLEIAAARIYDPTIFSYNVLLSIATITGLLITILLSLTSKAS